MRGLLASVVGGLLMLPVSPLSSAASGASLPAAESFLSGGKIVRVEVFTPKSPGPWPAVVVLHGAGGVMGGNGFIRQMAAALPNHGFAIFLVHYFDRTETRWAQDETIRENFETWLSVLGDATAFVAQYANIDPTRIGCFGFSLGAYLAIAYSSRDPRVRAVVEFAGGIDPFHEAQTRRLPPTLILHGEADERVRVDRARELEALLQRLEAPYQIRVYPGEGHVLSPLAAIDALARGVEFLRAHLLAENTVSPAK